MIKLLFILVLSLFGFCTSDPVPISTSVGAQDGLYCDTLLCPAEANTCVVKSNSVKNCTKILTIRQCKQGDKILCSDETESNNPSKMTVNSYMESSFGASAGNSEAAKQIADDIQSNIQSGFDYQRQVANNIYHQGFGPIQRPHGSFYSRPMVYYNSYANQYLY